MGSANQIAEPDHWWLDSQGHPCSFSIHLPLLLAFSGALGFVFSPRNTSALDLYLLVLSQFI